MPRNPIPILKIVCFATLRAPSRRLSIDVKNIETSGVFKNFVYHVADLSWKVDEEGSGCGTRGKRRWHRQGRAVNFQLVP